MYYVEKKKINVLYLPEYCKNEEEEEEELYLFIYTSPCPTVSPAAVLFCFFRSFLRLATVFPYTVLQKDTPSRV